MHSLANSANRKCTKLYSPTELRFYFSVNTQVGQLPQRDRASP